MQKNVVSVEANLLANKAKFGSEKRVTIKQESSLSSNVNMDNLVKTMERMMERMTLTNMVAPRQPQGVPQIKNTNFRRQHPKLNKESQET